MSKPTISPELYEAVTNIEIQEVKGVGFLHIHNDVIHVCPKSYEQRISYRPIDLSKFFFMCKKWALEEGYGLSTIYMGDTSRCVIYRMDKMQEMLVPIEIRAMLGPDEKRLLFSACEHILEIKKDGL